MAGLHRFHIFNNISTAYRQKSLRVGEKGDGHFAKISKQALLRAIELSAQDDLVDEWAAAQLNLGAMLAEAATTAPPEKAHFLRIQSIAALHTSMEAYPQTLFHQTLTRAQFILARVLFDQAATSKPQIQEVYLARAINAYEAASINFDKSSNPDEWSECQFCIGLAFMLHADTSEKDTAIGDLKNAIKQFDAAKPGFQKTKSKTLKKLEAARREAVKILGGLDEQA